jgi:predicted SAM-dependent methyltransferase
MRNKTASELRRIIRKQSPPFVPLFLAIVNGVKSIVAKRRIKRLLKGRGEVLIDIGAGHRKGDQDWLGVDINDDCDIFWDLRKGMPFADESISKIYSSHLFEHLTYKEGRHLMNECMRTLRPGGTFSICVPNARVYIDAYVQEASLAEHPFLAYGEAYHRTTRIDYLNYIAYMDGHHKYMFDEDNLLHLLTSHGLRNARLREFDPSLDIQTRDFHSIYAIAEK